MQNSIQLVGRSGIFLSTVLAIMLIAIPDTILQHCNSINMSDQEPGDIYERHPAIIVWAFTVSIAIAFCWTWYVAGPRTKELGLPRHLCWTSLALGPNIVFVFLLLILKNNRLYGRRRTWTKGIATLNIISAITIFTMLLIYGRDGAADDPMGTGIEYACIIALYVIPPIIGSVLALRATNAYVVAPTTNDEEYRNFQRFLIQGGVLLAVNNVIALTFPSGIPDTVIGIAVFFDAIVIIILGKLMQVYKSYFFSIFFVLFTPVFFVEKIHTQQKAYELIGSFGLFLFFLGIRNCVLAIRLYRRSRKLTNH
jgi:hypothetical protein